LTVILLFIGSIHACGKSKILYLEAITIILILSGEYTAVRFFRLTIEHCMICLIVKAWLKIPGFVDTILRI
jgi:hypothetical protein